MSAPPLHRPQPPSRRGVREASPGAAWRLRPRGLLLVASLALRRRAASRRWRIGLALWAGALLALDLLFLQTARPPRGTGDAADALWREAGSATFEMAALVLAVALLLALPPLAAGQIPGDRTAGRLDVLRASLLSPAEIVAGHALASWATAGALLALAVPSLLPGAVLAGLPPRQVLAVLAVLAVVSLAISLLGAGLSVRAARRSGAIGRTVGAVAIIAVGLPILWSASVPVLVGKQEVTQYRAVLLGDHQQVVIDPMAMDVTSSGGTLTVPMLELDSGTIPSGHVEVDATSGAAAFDLDPVRSEDPRWSPSQEYCAKEVGMSSVPRSSALLVLLFPNPVVLVAESASITPGENVLGTVRQGVDRSARPTDPAAALDCHPASIGYPEDIPPLPHTPAWPVGLAVWLLAGGGAAALAVRRLSVPTRGVSAERGAL